MLFVLHDLSHCSRTLLPDCSSSLLLSHSFASFLYGDTQTALSAGGEAVQLRAEGTTPSLVHWQCWPWYNRSFWLQGTLLAPIQLAIRQNPQTSFHRDALQPLVPLLYTEAELLNLS